MIQLDAQTYALSSDVKWGSCSLEKISHTNPDTASGAEHDARVTCSHSRNNDSSLTFDLNPDPDANPVATPTPEPGCSPNPNSSS